MDPREAHHRIPGPPLGPSLLLRRLAPIIRAEWDGLATDADARWLLDALARSPETHDVEIARGTHLLHLEVIRTALWQGSIAFLDGASTTYVNEEAPPCFP